MNYRVLFQNFSSEINQTKTPLTTAMARQARTVSVAWIRVIVTCPRRVSYPACHALRRWILLAVMMPALKMRRRR